MKLFVGLGNPGANHARQRHNVGFMAVDRIAADNGFGAWSAKFQGSVADGRLSGASDKVVLLKPSTFMNESGRAVAEAARFFKLEAADIVVLYDELDLAPGKVRIKTGGGAGGHNGIRSIDQHLGGTLGKDYRRVRIGIGHPGHKDRVTGHVLGDFRADDQDWLDPLLDQIARHAGLLAEGEDAQFLNRIAMNADSNEPTGAKGGDRKNKRGVKATGSTGGSGGGSHIRQARKQTPDAPKTGPMAAMLKKLLGD